MAKIKNIFNLLKTVINQPGLLLYALDNPETKKDYVINTYQLPYGLPVININDLLGEFDETVNPYTYLSGTSLPIDIALLKQLARQFSDCHYLEIGSWRGESLANVATVAKSCSSISLSSLEMREMGASDAFINVQRFFSKNLANVEHIEHNSHTFNYEKWGKKFDLIFVDGDHHYQGVKKDTQNVFKLLKDENSMIVWHDASFVPEVTRWEVIAGILDGAPLEERRSIYQVSNTLCAIYTKKKFQKAFRKGYSDPSIQFEVNIKSKNITKY